MTCPPGPPPPDSQIVFEALLWGGRKTAPRYLRDLDAAAKWLLSDDFAMIAGTVSTVTFRFLAPSASTEAGGKKAA